MPITITRNIAVIACRFTLDPTSAMINEMSVAPETSRCWRVCVSLVTARRRNQSETIGIDWAATCFGMANGARMTSSSSRLTIPKRLLPRRRPCPNTLATHRGCSNPRCCPSARA